MVIRDSPLVAVILERSAAEPEFGRYFLVGQVAFATEGGFAILDHILDAVEYPVDGFEEREYPLVVPCNQFVIVHD